MAQLFSPPPKLDLPLSKGGDLTVTFIYKPLVVDGSGEPILDGSGNKQYTVTNYPGGSTVQLVIDTSPATTANATISGSSATVVVDHTIVDAIPKGVPWRVILANGGAEQVVTNGRTVRFDG